MSNKITPILKRHSNGTISVEFYNEFDRRIGGMILQKGDPVSLVARVVKELEKKQLKRMNPRRCRYRKSKKSCLYRLATKRALKKRPKRRNGIIDVVKSTNLYQVTLPDTGKKYMIRAKTPQEAQGKLRQKFTGFRFSSTEPIIKFIRKGI